MLFVMMSSSAQKKRVHEQVQDEELEDGEIGSEKRAKVSDFVDGFLELGGSRKVSVSEFRGKVYINIREYYTKDGQELPGKKGISLTPDQWKKMCANIEEINAQLQEKLG